MTVTALPPVCVIKASFSCNDLRCILPAAVWCTSIESDENLHVHGMMLAPLPMGQIASIIAQCVLRHAALLPTIASSKADPKLTAAFPLSAVCTDRQLQINVWYSMAHRLVL